VSADISVVIPVHNEGPRLAETILSIARTRTTRARVEVVIADDGSDDAPTEHLGAAWPDLAIQPALEVVVTSTP
jgi:GT2 family glycosyltransferase